MFYRVAKIHISNACRMCTERNNVVVVGLIVLLFMTSCAAPIYEFPQGELQGCGPTLRLDIVSTESSRQRGLMGVKKLPNKYGMLFVFQDTIQPAFWMKDTLVPLEVVFMSNTGIIKAIIPMQPLSETVHQAPEPLPFALEVPQGWMAKHDVNVGDTCTIVLPSSLVVE